MSDPLCKPFSMGRNLFCVHSRKHMDDQPELKAEKQVGGVEEHGVVQETSGMHSCDLCREWATAFILQGVQH